jgi:hypothetical protein
MVPAVSNSVHHIQGDTPHRWRTLRPSPCHEMESPVAASQNKSIFLVFPASFSKQKEDN